MDRHLDYLGASMNSAALDVPGPSWLNDEGGTRLGGRQQMSWETCVNLQHAIVPSASFTYGSRRASTRYDGLHGSGLTS